MFLKETGRVILSIVGALVLISTMITLIGIAVDAHIVIGPG